MEGLETDSEKDEQRVTDRALQREGRTERGRRDTQRDGGGLRDRQRERRTDTDRDLQREREDRER